MLFANRYRRSVIATGEWISILPATGLLGLAALRSLQPTQYEPARTSALLLEWIASRLSHLDARLGRHFWMRYAVDHLAR